jgi:hypothetical protein
MANTAEDFEKKELCFYTHYYQGTKKGKIPILLEKRPKGKKV